MHKKATNTEKGIAQILGDNPVYQRPLIATQERTLFVARKHRVAPLLAHRIRDREGHLHAFPAIRAELGNSLRQQAALDLALGAELARVATSWAGAGVPLLFLKGAALAYGDYPAPFLRPRGDTDVLVGRGDRDRAHAVLAGLGYRERPAVTGERVSQQVQYTRVLATGVEHTIDLHWRTFNPAAFAGMLTFDTLWPARRPLPALGPDAVAPSRAHALLLAILHRVAHHEPGQNLLWLFDIHLLARALRTEEWATCTAAAHEYGVTALCVEALETVRDQFSTVLPESVAAWMDARHGERVPSRFRMFQRSGRRVIDVFASDFLATPTVRGRMALVREHLLPPARYMKARYGVQRGWLLPLLYLHRAGTGAWRWSRRDAFR